MPKDLQDVRKKDGATYSLVNSDGTAYNKKKKPLTWLSVSDVACDQEVPSSITSPGVGLFSTGKFPNITRSLIAYDKGFKTHADYTDLNIIFQINILLRKLNYVVVK